MRLAQFYTGTIKRAEFEELLRNLVKEHLPQAVVQEIEYGPQYVLVITDKEVIEVEVDFDELIIEE